MNKCGFEDNSQTTHHFNEFEKDGVKIIFIIESCDYGSGICRFYYINIDNETIFRSNDENEARLFYGKLLIDLKRGKK